MLYAFLIIFVDDLEDDDVTELFQLFHKLIFCSRREARYWCAYNFPAVIHYAGEKKFTMYFKEDYSGLAADPDPKIRKSIAAGIPEVKILKCSG